MGRNEGLDVLQIQITPELKERLRRVSDAEGRSMSKQVVKLIEWGLPLREEQLRREPSPINLPNNLTEWPAEDFRKRRSSGE